LGGDLAVGDNFSALEELEGFLDGGLEGGHLPA
jgi:hypothetical protein